MSIDFLFGMFMKLDRLIHGMMNALVLEHLGLHDPWILPTLVVVSMMVSLGVVAALFYGVVRWIGWRSLVVFVLAPRIWVILLLYTKSVRLFWQDEVIDLPSPAIH